jgi:TRAP-type C4-dicarboxylate transport system permease small subunit
VLLVLMMLHVSLEVVMRYVFNAPMVGTLETVSYYYMVGAVFLPLALVERRGEHIRVDLVVRFLPAGVQLGLYVFACLVGLAFFAMLFRQSLIDAWRATVGLETIMSNYIFYIWPSRWALPLGFLGALLAIAANLARALRERRAL